MKKYFPILKSKSGDLSALNTLSGTVKDKIAPLIEIVPDSFHTIENTLIGKWNFDGNQVLLDPSIILNENNSTNDIETLFDALTADDINIVPVVDFNSSDEYIELVAQYVAVNYSVAIRILPTFPRPQIFNPLIVAMTERLGLTSDNTILIFDLGVANDNNHLNLANSVINNIKALPDINEWLQIVVASGSFPVNVSSILKHTVKTLPRYEWIIWNTIQSDRQIKKHVYYGDYGIKYPIFEQGGSPYPGTATIKYTSQDAYIIFRGELPKNHALGNGQYHEKSRLVIGHPNYDGNTFSIADRAIYDCANRNTNPGNAGTWVRISQGRHISKVSSLV